VACALGRRADLHSWDEEAGSGGAHPQCAHLPYSKNGLCAWKTTAIAWFVDALACHPSGLGPPALQSLCSAFMHGANQSDICLRDA
jgi:hypothetical protein